MVPQQAGDDARTRLLPPDSQILRRNSPHPLTVTSLTTCSIFIILEAGTFCLVWHYIIMVHLLKQYHLKFSKIQWVTLPAPSA